LYPANRFTSGYAAVFLAPAKEDKKYVFAENITAEIEFTVQ
jgi:hypothetical protein